MVFSEEGEAGLAGLDGIQEVTGSIPVISTTGSAGSEALKIVRFSRLFSVSAELLLRGRKLFDPDLTTI